MHLWPISLSLWKTVGDAERGREESETLGTHCYIEVSLPLRNCGRNELCLLTDNKQLLGPACVLLLLRNANMHMQQHIRYLIRAEVFWHCGSLLFSLVLYLVVSLSDYRGQGISKRVTVSIFNLQPDSHSRPKSKYVQMLNRIWIKRVQLHKRDTGTSIEELKRRGR